MHRSVGCMSNFLGEAVFYFTPRDSGIYTDYIYADYFKLRDTSGFVRAEIREPQPPNIA